MVIFYKPLILNERILAFDKGTKDKLLIIAGHYGIEIIRQLNEQEIQAELFMASVNNS